MNHKLRKKLTGLLDNDSSKFKEIYKNYKHAFTEEYSPGINSGLQLYFDYFMAYETCENLGLCRLAQEYLEESEEHKRRLLSLSKSQSVKVIYTNVLK